MIYSTPLARLLHLTLQAVADGTPNGNQMDPRTWRTWPPGLPASTRPAIVESVHIGVGSVNIGVTAYVNSLRIAVGDYD